MARTITFPRVLWLSTAVWLGCGRLDFDPLADGTGRPQPDAPVAVAPAPQLGVASMMGFTTPCGAVPAASQLAIANPGTADLVITSAAIEATADVFVVTDALPITIAPGSSSALHITPPMAVVGTDRGGTLKTSVLTIDSNAGSQMVTLVATVAGANIEPAQTSLSFAAGNGSCPGQQGVSVANTGTQSVNLSIATAGGGGLAFSGFSGGVLSAGSTVTVVMRPTQCGMASDVVNFLANGAISAAIVASNGLCTTKPINVTLNITGTSTSGCACS